MNKTTLLIIAIWIWAPINLNAETIYTWKDENGIFRSSNEQPPENVKDYNVTTYEAESSTTSEHDNRRRSSYDQMVKQASKETSASEKQRMKAAAAKTAEKQQLLKKQRNDRIKAERRQLEQKIEALKKRAVSRTFPNGMKQAQINALVEEIKKLDKRPDTPAEK